MVDIRIVIAGLAGAVLLAGCPDGQETEQVREQAKETLAAAEESAEEMVSEGMRLDEDVPKRAVAVLQPTEGNDASGTVTIGLFGDDDKWSEQSVSLNAGQSKTVTFEFEAEESYDGTSITVDTV